ncbi:MAG: tRNA pseudouridine(55) synthase TruB [Arcanobacterium sp.]|nr:tRNA pseudouridine(55) synthase TruB [Arcanobacterium sp.]
MAKPQKTEVQRVPRKLPPWGEVPRAQLTAPDGLLLVDKPQGATSHDVVGAVRRLAATRKVGHAGTLDPMATGLLTIGIGRATKLLNYLTGCDKTYQAEICFGLNTTTEDAEGEPIYQNNLAEQRNLSRRLKELTSAEIDAAILEFTGAQLQVPSSVSALKINGKRAYELVRAGEQVELPPRPIVVYRFERISDPVYSEEIIDGVPLVSFLVEVSVSAGTYIRALARDLGEKLQVGAHLRMLRRIDVGSWNVQDAWEVATLANEISAGNELPVISLSEVCLEFFPRITVSEAEAADLVHGRFVTPRKVLPSSSGIVKRDDGVFAAFKEDGTVVSLCVNRGKWIKPELLLSL